MSLYSGDTYQCADAGGGFPVKTIAPKVQRAPEHVELEPELIEADAKISMWIWVAVAIVVVFGVLFAPFQLF